MDLAHNTARLVCCEYKEGEYNTCIGAACTSSIELTCSCTCGRMPIAHGHAYASDVVMRTQQFDSSLAFLGLHTGYMGHGHAPGPALLIIRAVGVYAYDAGGVPLRSTTCDGAACTSSTELTCSRTCGRMAITYAHAHTIRLRSTPYYTHMHYSWQSPVGYVQCTTHSHACSSIVTSQNNK